MPTRGPRAEGLDTPPLSRRHSTSGRARRGARL